MMSLEGIPASPGIAIGKAFLYCDAENIPAKRNPEIAIVPEAEQARLDDATKTSTEQIKRLAARCADSGDKTSADVLNGHLCMLRDPELVGEARRIIGAERISAEEAVTRVISETAEIFAGMDDDPYLKERAADVEDVGLRLLQNLSGVEKTDISALPPDTVIIARDLKPSDTARLDRVHTLAFATDSGGATSHTAILAKTMGIVAVVGCGNATAAIATGDVVIVDGTSGTVMVNPEKELIDDYVTRRNLWQQRKRELLARKDIPCVAKSGKKITLAANVGNIDDIDAALANGAEAIGLFRTEFLYLERNCPPVEEEQYAIYRAAAEKMQGRPVIVRTLDIGGDKQVPYLNLPAEDNPFLGVRAIRLCFRNEEIFRTQLRALLRAAVHGNIEIMFPMVQSVADIETAKRFLAECAKELESEGKSFRADLPVGIMIEIPAAAIISDELAKHCDFFSIGTNDLTQYTLAVDRGNKAIADLYDSFHPAVLELIRMTVASAHRNGIPCGMCGEFAANAKAIPLLLGYGLDEFSMSAGLIQTAKEIIMNPGTAEELLQK